MLQEDGSGKPDTSVGKEGEAMTQIHRYNLNGNKALCGVDSGTFSITGAVVTCPACLKVSRPLTKEEALASITQAAKHRRTP